VDQEKNENNQNIGCCGGGTNENKTSCGCGGSSSQHSKLRILLFAFIMLAAVGVGAYSLLAKSPSKACTEQGCGGSQNCCGK
jgi:hypothetical protein